jgi:hypothetical protein
MTLAGGVNPDRYRPAFVHQHYPKLARDGKDDCRVMMAQALVAAASLGETQRTGLGHEMSIDQLVRQAVAMRDNLDRDEQTGPLNETHTTRMIELMWPEFPLLTPDDIRFWELLERMRNRGVASISGAASRIKNQSSPLHRTSGGHELGLFDIRGKQGDEELLVYDPWRRAGKGKRGEWRPAVEIKQFAYKDSDQDLLAVFVERRGSLTEERLTARRLNAKHAGIESELLARNAALKAQFADTQPGTATAKAAGWESALVHATGAIEELRVLGPEGA